MSNALRDFVAGICAAMAHPTRVAIIEQLQTSEMSVAQLCETLGVGQANASQHLAVLRSKHVVGSTRNGNRVATWRLALEAAEQRNPWPTQPPAG